MAPVIIFGVFALLGIFSMFNGGLSRGQDVGIFNPTDKGEAIFQRRNEGYNLGLHDQVSRIFSNKYTFVVDEFIKNYATYFSLQFLFTEGPKERTYGMIPGMGVFYLAEILFFAIALYTLARKNEWKKFGFILFWILIAPIPAALAKGGGFAANRAALMMPAIQIISAYGLYIFWEEFKFKWLRWIVVGVIAISLLFFLENYIYHAPTTSAESMMYGRREMVLSLKELEPQYEQIIVSRSLSEPHIYFAFYNAWDPVDYQINTTDWWRYKEEGRSFLDQLGTYSLGKYIFTNVDYAANSQIKGILLVGKPGEFPQGINTLRTINFPNGKPAIFIVDPTKTSYAQN